MFFASSLSASNCIAGNARYCFSQACGGAYDAQPPSAAITSPATTMRSAFIFKLAHAQRCADALLDIGLALVLEPVLDQHDLALGVDQVRTRHRLDLPCGRCRAHRIEDYGELGR